MKVRVFQTDNVAINDAKFEVSALSVCSFSITQARVITFRLLRLDYPDFNTWPV